MGWPGGGPARCRAIPRAMRTRSATTPHLVPVADQAAAVLAPDHRGFILPPDLEGTVAQQFPGPVADMGGGRVFLEALYHTRAFGSSSLSHVPTRPASAKPARNIGIQSCRTPLCVAEPVRGRLR